jgi:uncharacterized membrane protein YfcA
MTTATLASDSATPQTHQRTAIHCGYRHIRSERMVDQVSHLLLLSTGVFAGALVSGLAGFAFSAVAGAFLLLILPPIEAIPLMMACSIAVQGASMLMLRRTMKWGGSLAFIAGGVLGIPPALYLLHHVDVRTFRTGFGIFLAAYAGYMLLRPVMSYVRDARPRLPNTVVGFAGGLVGGLTAMPGALPTIWCDLCGMSKEQQRGLVQPFIASMQVFALALVLPRSEFSGRLLVDLTLSLPALAAGTVLGVALFGRVNEQVFRRIVFTVLLVGGLGLALQ